MRLEGRGKGFHVAAALWVAAMLVFAQVAPDAYYDAMQEDRATEWLTVAFFLCAVAAFGVRALRGRRVGDGLVALFCIVAAGEEVSWGQRLIGFTPSERFLADNAQQEANLHNLVEAFGQPKWTLIAVLMVFGVVAPLAVRWKPLAALAERVRFTPSPPALVPWFALSAALLIWYPVRFTGEWVEALAGALFFVAARPAPRAVALGATLSAAFAIVMPQLSARLGSATPAQLACVRTELEAMSDAMTPPAVSARLASRTHRRLWSLVQDGEVPQAVLHELLRAPACAGEAHQAAASRRRYGVDPWGTAYWVRFRRTDSSASLELYSFGPNRRRDGAVRRGDDVTATREVLR